MASEVAASYFSVMARTPNRDRYDLSQASDCCWVPCQCSYEKASLIAGLWLLRRCGNFRSWVVGVAGFEPFEQSNVAAT